MPGGNISTVERIERLKEIKRLKEEEGLSNRKIAEELGMATDTVNRNVKYLENLSVADLSPEDRSKKRMEIELEFKAIAEAARDQFEEWKELKPTVARSYLMSWQSAWSEIAKIYGLDNQKVDNFTQINNLNNYEVPDKVDPISAKKIAEAIKKSHEESVQ
ncbi:MAG: winged helix-turn-helix transcriptional regulator [Promethearchaeota archaeon]